MRSIGENKNSPNRRQQQRGVGVAGDDNIKEKRVVFLVLKWLEYVGNLYYVLIIANSENILELTVLDENVSKLKQSRPFRIYGGKHDHVKKYVDKKKGTPFAIKLKRSAKLQVHPTAFALENINLMTY